jgi:CRP-like cAMP-binding protein
MENYKKQRGVTDLLKKVPLLKKLSDKEIQALSKELQKTKVYKDGQAIITQGEPGNGFFMIQSGQVDVTKKDPGSKKETHLATLNV